MSMQKLKMGDTVKVICGSDKGKVGEVIALPSEDYRIVSGINIRKKTVKRDPQRDQEGGFIEKEAKIHVSNLVMFDKQKGRPIKVGYKLLDNKTKVRYDKATGDPC